MEVQTFRNLNIASRVLSVEARDKPNLVAIKILEQG